MVSRDKKLRLLGRTARAGTPRTSRAPRKKTISPAATPGDDAKREPSRGERIPTEEDPRFALRCVCGGIAGGVFPVLDVEDDGRLIRQRKLGGVRCSGCKRTYTVEWPESAEDAS